MQKRKKHLLGLAGLALVGAMTVAAYAMPTSEAAAVGNGAETKVTVSVGSEGQIPTVGIKSLKTDDVVVNKTFTVTIEYSKATRLAVFLQNMGPTLSAREGMSPSEGEVEVSLAGSSCENISFSTDLDTCEVTYNLPGNLASEYGVAFVTRAAAINGNSGDSRSDSDPVEFVYRAAKFSGNVTYEKGTEDPIVHIEMGDDVKNGQLVIFDKNGKPIFGDSETDKGQFPAINIEGWTSGNNGKLDVTLPFKKNGIPTGEYTAVLIAYGEKNEGEENAPTIALATEHFSYSATGGNLPIGPTDPDDPNKPVNPTDPEKPVTPETPDTGLNLFKDLNISRADYIITGLIAFGMVTAFAAFLMIRRSKR